MNETVEVRDLAVLPKDGTTAKGRITGISDNLAFVIDPQRDAVNIAGEYPQIAHYSVLPNEGAEHRIASQVRSSDYLSDY
jgi:hypothetical protein